MGGRGRSQAAGWQGIVEAALVKVPAAVRRYLFSWVRRHLRLSSLLMWLVQMWGCNKYVAKELPHVPLYFQHRKLPRSQGRRV